MKGRVDIYKDLHIFTYFCIYLHIFAYIWLYLHICAIICTYLYKFDYISYKFAYMCSYSYTFCIYLHIFTYIYVHLHIFAYICLYEYLCAIICIHLKKFDYISYIFEYDCKYSFIFAHYISWLCFDWHQQLIEWKRDIHYRCIIMQCYVPCNAM